MGQIVAVVVIIIHPTHAGHNIADIDECSRSQNRCPHKCVNTPGSFRCECPKGYYIPERDPYKCLGESPLTLSSLQTSGFV